MNKLQIAPQATKFDWWEDTQERVFHVEIVCVNEESAKNVRAYLPIVERILLNGFETKKPKHKSWWRR